MAAMTVMMAAFWSANKLIGFTSSSTQPGDGNSAENFRILKSGQQRMDVGMALTPPWPHGLDIAKGWVRSRMQENTR
jgi:hypothetical protein